MSVLELLALGIGLSADAFAVSLCKGFAMRRAGCRTMITCGCWFGAFQAVMPLLGYVLGSFFAEAIRQIDHWVAFGLLAVIGINMIREAVFPGESDPGEDGDLSVKTMLILAIATSIDALAVGISLAMAGNVNIWLAVSLIGITTFCLSAAGVRVGCIFGSRFEAKAQIAGGVILILIGIRILAQHLGGAA